MAIKTIVAANGTKYYPLVSLTDTSGRELHFAYSRGPWRDSNIVGNVSIIDDAGERVLDPEFVLPGSRNPVYFAPSFTVELGATYDGELPSIHVAVSASTGEPGWRGERVDWWRGTKSQQRFYNSLKQAIDELRDANPELLQGITNDEQLAGLRASMVRKYHGAEYDRLLRDYIELGGDGQEAIELIVASLREGLAEWIA